MTFDASWEKQNRDVADQIRSIAYLFVRNRFHAGAVRFGFTATRHGILEGAMMRLGAFGIGYSGCALPQSRCVTLLPATYSDQ